MKRTLSTRGARVFCIRLLHVCFVHAFSCKRAISLHSCLTVVSHLLKRMLLARGERTLMHFINTFYIFSVFLSIDFRSKCKIWAWKLAFWKTLTTKQNFWARMSLLLEICSCLLKFRPKFAVTFVCIRAVKALFFIALTHCVKLFLTHALTRYRPLTHHYYCWYCG